MANGNFNFEDILRGNGIFGGYQKPSIADIAEKQQIQALQEQLKAKDAEIARLKETILRCPKCGTKLRLPR